jgi:RND family efflux transporter MFP subunit
MNALKASATATILMGGALLLLNGCAAQPVVTVREEPVRYASLSSVLAETGILQRADTITIPAGITGNIRRIYVHAGERVTRGRPLASIADVGHAIDEQRLTTDAALSKARIALQEAERAYRADTYLYRQQGISRDALMQSQMRMLQARIGYREVLLSRRLRQTDERMILAPRDGTVESVASHPNDELRPIEQGDPVVAGQALFTLATSRGFVVRAEIDEQDVYAVRIGQRVRIGGENLGNATLSGHIVGLTPTVRRSDDPANASRRLIATIEPAKPPPFLRDGMSVDVDIVTHDEPHVLVVPLSALIRDAHGAYVYAVRDGKATIARVLVGTRNETKAAIHSGLRAGDIVVSERHPAIKPGIAIKATSAQAS